jgi:hypothetical protein
MTLNALIGRLRSVSVPGEMKAMVANFRDDYQQLQSTIAVEKKVLESFKFGKPIVLNIHTNDDRKIVIGKCNISEVNKFRQLAGKGQIEVNNDLVTFYPDLSAGIDNRYPLGAIAKTSDPIEGKQQVNNFEFEILYDRIDELKADSREVLADFRTQIERRGWDKREVFAAIAQMVGEKSISQDFLLSALPQTLNEFVFEEGAGQIILDTQYPQYLNAPTKYLVTTGSDNFRQLQAKVEIDGKQQWIQAGRLTDYSIQLLDKTTFEGTISPNYNTVTFKCPGDRGSILVGKLTDEGKSLIDSNRVNEIRLSRTQTSSYRLVAPSAQIDMPINNITPEVAAIVGDEQSVRLTLERLKIFDNKFSATVAIDGETYYLAGVSPSDSFEKKNRDTVVAPVRNERFEGLAVEIVKAADLESTIAVYSDRTRIGEIR